MPAGNVSITANYTAIATYILPAERTSTGHDINFDPSDLPIGRDASNSQTADKFSISMWVRFPEIGSSYYQGYSDPVSEGIFGSGNGSSNGTIRIWFSWFKGGYRLTTHLRLQGDFYDQQNVELAHPTSASTWNHLVIAINAGQVNYYLDGSFLKALNFSAADSLTATGYQGINPTIGRAFRSGSLPSNHYLADVALFDYQLSGSQVSDIYNNRKYVNPIALYRLDGNVLDETGQNNGTFVSGGYQSSANPY